MPYSDNFNLKWRSMFVSKSLPWFHKTVRKIFFWRFRGSLFLYISFNMSLCLILDLDDPSLSVIHDKYLTCLRTFTKKHFPNQPNRVEELLVRLPEVSSLRWNEYLWFHDLISLEMFYSKIIWIIVFIIFHRSRKLPLFCWSPKCFTCHSY